MLLDNSIDKISFQSLLTKLGIKVSNASEMLENLLIWSKGEFMQRKALPVNVEIDGMLIETSIQLKSVSNEKKIEFNIKCEPNTTAYIEPEVIRIVLRNLFINAIKFSYNGSIVEVKAFKLNEYVYITISDTGCGISEENKHKLFSDNDYLSTYGTQNEKGAGIGLKLCKTILPKNNASISVDSIIDIGTTFTITLKATNN